MFPFRSLVLVCAVPLLAAWGLSPALADEAPEHERLAAFVRQLDLIDRLAEGVARAASADRARYRFDYIHLARVRVGVKDYWLPCARLHGISNCGVQGNHSPAGGV